MYWRPPWNTDSGRSQLSKGMPAVRKAVAHWFVSLQQMSRRMMGKELNTPGSAPEPHKQGTKSAGSNGEYTSTKKASEAVKSPAELMRGRCACSLSCQIHVRGVPVYNKRAQRRQCGGCYATRLHWYVRPVANSQKRRRGSASGPYRGR